MSKKSRRRNKKILAALALAGGAAMLGRRRKASIADMDDAGINVTHPALTERVPERVPDRVKNILAAPKKVETVDAGKGKGSSKFDTKYSKANETISKGERARALAANAKRNAMANYYKIKR